jgi:hypothetical protein
MAVLVAVGVLVSATAPAALAASSRRRYAQVPAVLLAAMTVVLMGALPAAGSSTEPVASEEAEFIPGGPEWETDAGPGPGVVVEPVPGMGGTSVEAAVSSLGDEVSSLEYRGFEVFNGTGYPMRFEEAAEYYADTPPRFDDDGPAAPGTIFAQAGLDRWDLTFWFMQMNGARMTYSFELPNRQRIQVQLVGTMNSFHATPEAKCLVVNPKLSCGVAHTSPTTRRFVIHSAAPTTIELGGEDRQRQADALQALCDSGSSHTTCTYRLTSTVSQGHGETRTIGMNQYRNCTTIPGSMDVSWEFTEGYSHSLGGSINLGFQLSKVVQMGVQVNYQHSWSWSRAYSELHRLPVAPLHRGYFTHQPAVITATGDFTATLYNDTIIIKDVSFTVPDYSNPNPEGTGIITAHNIPLTEEEITTHCHR